MIMEPSWSTISRSSCEGGEQNRCWKIWSTDSTVLGVSFRATAMCPRVRIVLVEIRLDSLNNPKHCSLRNCTLVRVYMLLHEQLLNNCIIICSKNNEIIDIANQNHTTAKNIKTYYKFSKESSEQERLSKQSLH